MEKEHLLVKIGLQAWHRQIGIVGQWLQVTPAPIWLNPIAPGRNRGIYLIGHLIAVHDALNTILGIGDRAHTALDEAFIKNPDNSGLEMPSIEALKKYWIEVHDDLERKFTQLQPEDWFTRHQAMTDEEFARNPARNKMSVLMNRTNHAAFHTGQLRLLR